ncbi:MAG: Mpo1-like protein [Pseudomonadota bacterium]
MDTPITRNVDHLISRYGESHQNPVNKLIHWFCVPAIVYSVLGILWIIPTPSVLQEVSPLLNWATLFVIASMFYYLFLSFSLSVGMLFVSGGLIYLLSITEGLSMPLWQIAILVFVVAWIVQFIGHYIEGKKPSFVEDVQFLMIGPLWLLSALYRRLKIPY